MSGAAPQSPREALIAALVARLKADESVQALAPRDVDGVKVYDGVPSKKTPAYVQIGPVNFTIEFDPGGGCGIVLLARFRIFAVTVDFGRHAAGALGFACFQSLHEHQLTLADPYVSSRAIAYRQDGDVIDPSEPSAVFYDFEAPVGWPT